MEMNPLIIFIIFVSVKESLQNGFPIPLGVTKCIFNFNEYEEGEVLEIYENYCIKLMCHNNRVQLMSIGEDCQCTKLNSSKLRHSGEESEWFSLLPTRNIQSESVNVSDQFEMPLERDGDEHTEAEESPSHSEATNSELQDEINEYDQAVSPSYDYDQAVSPSYEYDQADSPSYEYDQADSPSYEYDQADSPSYENDDHDDIADADAESERMMNVPQDISITMLYKHVVVFLKHRCSYNGKYPAVSRYSRFVAADGCTRVVCRHLTPYSPLWPTLVVQANRHCSCSATSTHQNM